MSALEGEIFVLMEWFGGCYSEYMRMPVSRRKRFVSQKDEMERNRDESDRKQAAELRAATRASVRSARRRR